MTSNDTENAKDIKYLSLKTSSSIYHGRRNQLEAARGHVVVDTQLEGILRVEDTPQVELRTLAPEQMA